MLHTTSKGHWPFVPDNKMFKGFFTHMGAVALTLELSYSHCLIRFNRSSENDDFGFNSIQKINFSKKKSHMLNAIGSKFDLDVKKFKVKLGSSFEQTS